MNRFLNNYFGYTAFANDSSHHDNKSDRIKFIGIARKDLTVAKKCIMMTFLTDSYSAVSDIDVIGKSLSETTSENYFTYDSKDHSWHILTDDMNLTYVVIFKHPYPQRCAYMCLTELKSVFQTNVVHKKIESIKEGGLNSVFKCQLVKLCEKYNDTASVDSLAATMKKVNSVKLVLQDNIDIALQNIIKIEDIQRNTDDLSKKANIFKKHGGQLKNKMYWRNMKTRLIVGCLVLVVLGAIAGAVAYFISKSKKDTNNSQVAQ